MPKIKDSTDIQEIYRRIGGGGEGGTTNYTALSNKPQINGIELLGNKSSNDLRLIGNLGNEAVSGEPYHFTYYYEQIVATDKITVKAHTITLDNNKTLATYDLTVLPATNTTAGLLSATDKVKYDGYDTTIASKQDILPNASAANMVLKSSDTIGGVEWGTISASEFIDVEMYYPTSDIKEDAIYRKAYLAKSGWKRFTFKDNYKTKYSADENGITNLETSVLTDWDTVSAESDTKWVGYEDDKPINNSPVANGEILYGPDGSGPVTGSHAMIYYKNLVRYEYKTYKDGMWNYLGNARALDILPAPDIEYLGEIVQYIGEDNALLTDYKQGHFYKCIEDSANPGEYIWNEISLGGASISAVAGNALVEKTDGLYVESPAYTYIKQLGDFFYEIQINQDQMNLSEATTYFLRSTTNLNMGTCTGVYHKGKVLRQYDWYYDNAVEFLLRVAPDREKGTYGSIGISSAIPFFTKSIVGNGKYYEQYKYIPYGTCDGVNEKGLFVQQNVTPVKSAAINVTHTCAEEDYKGKITVNMIPRVLLDNCANMLEVLAELYKYDIVRPTKFPANYDAHYLIADSEGGHAILEFSDDGTSFALYKYGTSEDKEIMTNFNCNSSTGAITENTFAIDWNLLSADNGANAGLERWELCATELAKANPSLENLRNQMIYTNMYTRSSETDYKWLTEYCGETDPVGGDILTPAKAKSDPDNFTSTYNQAISDYNNRVRGDNKSWQSVHACIYDLINKSVNVVIQERTDEPMEFKLDNDKVITGDGWSLVNTCEDLGTTVNFIGNLVIVSFAIKATTLIDEQEIVMENLPEAANQAWGAMIGNKASGTSKFYIDADSTEVKLDDALSSGSKYVGTLIYIRK